MMSKKVKRRFGDRKDGALVRDLDGMHLLCRIFSTVAATTRRLSP